MGFVLGFQGQNFFYAMIPSWFKVFCKLCSSSFVWCAVCVYEYFAHFCFGVFVFTMQLVHGICFLFYGVLILLLSFVFPLTCVLFFVPTHLMFLILVVFLHQFFICNVLKFGFLSLGFCLLLVFWVLVFVCYTGFLVYACCAKFLFIALGFLFLSRALGLLVYFSRRMVGMWLCNRR